LLLWSRWEGNIDRLLQAGAQQQRRRNSTANNRTAVSSKDEQCYVYSRRRRLNTWLSRTGSTVSNTFNAFMQKAQNLIKNNTLTHDITAKSRSISGIAQFYNFIVH